MEAQEMKKGAYFIEIYKFGYLFIFPNNERTPKEVKDVS